MYIEESIRYIPSKEFLDRLKEENPDTYRERYGFIPCFVDDVLVMFHRLCDYDDSTIPNEYKSSKGLMGIVEFSDGAIKKVPARKIKFIKHIRMTDD
jgi:hypothetical protein